LGRAKVGFHRIRGNPSRVRNKVKSESLVGLALGFLRIRETGNPGRDRVSTRAGLIQSVISVDTSGKICTFPMIEGMNQETV